MLVYLQMIDTEEDRHKFEIIYEEYRQTMIKVAYKVLHNKQDAEDAVHLAFLKVAEIITTIEDAISPRTEGLMVVIAKNKAIDIYRENERKGTVELQEWDEDVSAEIINDGLLVHCIAKLQDNYRNLLLLKYYHGYSTNEVARIMGISEVNASKLDQRAKKKLKEMYDKENSHTH